MSHLLLIFLLFILSPLSFARHIIIINSSASVEFSSLAWDPIAHHFVVGSNTSPTIYAIPDVGVVRSLISEPLFNNSTVSTTAVAIDHIRQRLIVSFSNHSSIVAYDLKSSKKVFTVPLPELDGAPSGIVVDLEGGEIFVSSSRKGIVLKIGLEGQNRTLISKFKIPGDHGLGGLVHINHGYIITVQPATRKFFKVDSKNGTVEEVLSRDNTTLLEPTTIGHSIALQSNLSIVATTNDTLLSIESDDTWKQVDVANNMKLPDGKTVVAVAIREGTTYVLIKSQEAYSIEEVLWGDSSKRDFHLFISFLAVWICIFIWLVWETKMAIHLIWGLGKIEENGNLPI